MGNGYSIEQMIEMIFEGQAEMRESIKSLTTKVDGMAMFGCAQREGDLLRIKNLETWRDRGIASIIGALFISLGSLLGMMFGRN